eukprot:scaffold20361_cov102-Isochrysis_galbana.AAC.12
MGRYATAAGAKRTRVDSSACGDIRSANALATSRSYGRARAGFRVPSAPLAARALARARTSTRRSSSQTSTEP